MGVGPSTGRFFLGGEIMRAESSQIGFLSLVVNEPALCTDDEGGA